jgi:4-diphosphocytidyl-2-C-methyl-D-erythritol kinase
MAEWSNWPAPAKLNLFLHILGRRADGYHVLQTVFQLLDWGDRVRLRPREDGRLVRVSGLAEIPPERDLAVRAAIELRRATGVVLGVDISVDKQIPSGGGLGGGSSDAASVLVALNEIWNTGLGEDELAQIGLRLGADVPVFVRGHSAWAEGIGEQLTTIDLPRRHYVVVDPHVHVPTAELFQAAELTRNSPPLTITDYLAGAETTNVFAPVVRERYAQVAAAMDWLNRYGNAQLSGSGGCVFAAVDAETADAFVQNCPAQFAAFSAAGVNRSPLHEAVDAYKKRWAVAKW